MNSDSELILRSLSLYNVNDIQYTQIGYTFKNWKKKICLQFENMRTRKKRITS
jgi:hypothetical protein